MSLHKVMIEHMLYPAMEHLKGNQIRPKLRHLKESGQSGGLREQQERLTKLLLHCVQHVPAYQSLGIDEEAIRRDPMKVLREQIPVLPKRQFQQKSEQYLADNIPASARIANCTGGSTGQPVQFFMTRDQVEAYEAARWRGLSWYGITQGSRSVMLWGNPIELSQQAQKKQRMREHLLKNRTILSAYDLTPRRVEEHLAFMKRYQPEYLYGYASILTAFARLIEAQGLTVPVRMKAVVSTSETLEPWQAELLQRVFHCPVANEYGARDAGILAYSCPRGGMHITVENCVVEVLDPSTMEPVPAGQSGILAITDLGNYVQPRLRYLLGDMGTLSETPCDCGLELPTLAHVDGREDDLLIGPNGAMVHGNVIGQILRPLPGMRAFRFRQHTPETATLSLVTEDGTAQEGQIRELLGRVLPNVTITIEYVEEIPPTASGKQRYAIRECPLAAVPQKQE